MIREGSFATDIQGIRKRGPETIRAAFQKKVPITSGWETRPGNRQPQSFIEKWVMQRSYKSSSGRGHFCNPYHRWNPAA